MQYIHRYNTLLIKRPYTTKCITCAFIGAVGNCLSQYVERKQKNQSFSGNFDTKQCANMALFGSGYVAPVLHNWYGILERFFPQQGVKSTLLKVSFDQTFFASFMIASFMIGLSALNGESFEKGFSKFKEHYWEAILVNWKIWPLVMVLNFRLVPLQFQVLFVNFVAIFWNAYLSYVTNSN